MPMSLKKWNVICATTHLVCFGIVLGLTIGIEKINVFRLPVQTSYARWDDDVGPITELQEIGKFPFAAVTTVVPFLSFMAHVYAATFGWSRYKDNINHCRNPLRWVEYAFSASLMFVLIAMLFAIYDVSLLITLFTLNATVMYMGHVMETVNPLLGLTKTIEMPIKWQPFIIGSSISVVEWALLYSTLASADYSKIPWFVYALVFSYFFLYISFALNMMWFYRNPNGYKKGNLTLTTIEKFMQTEKNYMWLSLFSKTLLLILIFWGTLMPN